MTKQDKMFLYNRKRVITSLEAARGVYVNHRDFVDKIRGIEKQLDPDFCKNNLIHSEHRTAKNLVYLLTQKGCKAIAERLSAKKQLAFKQRYKELFNPANQTPETNSTDPKMEPSKPEEKSVAPYVPQTVEDLGVFIKDDVPVVSTRRIAECFEKSHRHVLDAVRNCFNVNPFFSRPNFRLAKYSDAQGKPRTEYLVTEDGFMFLVMGFTGEKAAQIKERFITEFKAMKARLKQTASAPVIDLNDPVELAKLVHKYSGEFLKEREANTRLLARNFELEAQHEEDAPKVDLAKAYLIAEDGDVEVGEYAQELLQKKGLKEIMIAGQLVKMGRNHLLAWFVENKHVIRLRKGNGFRPIGIAKDKELIRIYNVTLRNGKRYEMPYITPAGNDYFIRELRRQKSERDQVMMLTSDGLKLLPAADMQPNTASKPAEIGRAKKRRKVK